MERPSDHDPDAPADPFPLAEPRPADRREDARPSQEDRLWAIAVHLSIFVSLGLIGPLVVLLVLKDSRPWVAREAQEALNFHITIVLLGLAGLLLMLVLVGIGVLIVVAALALVLPILAAIRAGDGRAYRYPLTVRLVQLV